MTYDYLAAVNAAVRVETSLHPLKDNLVKKTAPTPTYNQVELLVRSLQDAAVTTFQIKKDLEDIKIKLNTLDMKIAEGDDELRKIRFELAVLKNRFNSL